VSEIHRHIGDHLRTIEILREEAPVIQEIADRLTQCLRDGGCVFWAGNGGSASDCQHLAAELVGRFERERAGFASVALTTDSSILTSVSNDYGFDRVFARQVEALSRPGDLLIGISTSGNSPNVLRAVETAAAMGIGTIGLSGRDGGELRKLADVCLVVRSDNTARIQEAHILIGHILCDLAERRVSASSGV
jgi:D-sedoheptulose 7-phosphate isomerase